MARIYENPSFNNADSHLQKIEWDAGQIKLVTTPDFAEALKFSGLKPNFALPKGEKLVTARFPETMACEVLSFVVDHTQMIHGSARLASFVRDVAEQEGLKLDVPPARNFPRGQALQR